jgi:uncharacterized protein YybS (DUF2232 family)
MVLVVIVLQSLRTSAAQMLGTIIWKLAKFYRFWLISRRLAVILVGYVDHPK